MASSYKVKMANFGAGNSPDYPVTPPDSTIACLIRPLSCLSFQFALSMSFKHEYVRKWLPNFRDRALPANVPPAGPPGCVME
jgi:hypothetical protein